MNLKIYPEGDCVQLPTFNELHVVERLINAVSNLDYPKDRLQTRYWTIY